MKKIEPKEPTASHIGPWRIQVLTPMLIRLEYDPSECFEDRFSQIVVNRSFPDVACTITEEPEQIRIRTEQSDVTLSKQEFRFSAMQPCTGAVWNYGEPLHNYGGTARTLDEVDGSLPLEDGLFSEEGIAVLEDRTCLIDGEHIFPRDLQSRDLYLFLYGKAFAQGLRDFYSLCGRTPLLPKYAMGNWWSRYWAYSEQDYLELMDRFERENIPFSVAVVDMDWHLVDVPEEYDGWTGFTWNRELFPDPERFLEELHRRKLHVTLNLHPAKGVQPFEEAYPAVARDLGISDGSPAAFDFTDEKFRRTYFNRLLHPMEEQGVDFWWIDWQQGTSSKIAGLDPLWLLNHFQFLDHTQRGKEPLILSRYAGPGSHRYPIGFSGDTVVTWDSLRFQPQFTATAANIGYGWWSHDIGGHMNGIKDDELAARWLQLGVFSPINRLHSTNNPYAGKEPWNYRAEACEVMKNYLRLRQKLIPYLYSMNCRAHEEGIPLVRPLYHVWPEQEEAYRFPTEFPFGSELLAAPITEPADPKSGLGQTEVWLPDGIWYDFFTGLRYHGNRSFRAYRNLSGTPVFAKAGSIVPMQEQEEILTLRVFPGTEGSFTVWDEAEDESAFVSVRAEHTGNCLTVCNPGRNQIQLCFVGTRITVAEVEVDGVFCSAECCYDPRNHLTRICLPGIGAHICVTVREETDQQEAIRLDSLDQLLRYSQMSLDAKYRLFEELKELGRLPEDCAELLKRLVTRAYMPAREKKKFLLRLEQTGKLEEFLPDIVQAAIRELTES